jgi:formylglycine-generating enzyme required for sulfatase activity/serine/threonine protein kinase
MLAPNTILKGRYRIVRQLGHGGMGAVYEAFNDPVSSLVALKETFATTESQREAFEREAKLLANLDHDAFPRVMDHFFEGDGQYLVMELVRGNNLWELLQIRELPFPPDKVLEWADQLLDALHELHNHTPPIVHRDIKPPNIKLTPRGKIKLLDFGIAKGTAGEMTFGSGQPMSIIGFTPHFAPLEQTLRSDRRWVDALEVLRPDVVAGILQSPTDPRSDIYSLGATLYHLMTNQVPGDAASRALAVWSGRPDPLPSADQVNPQISPEVAAVLHQAMALDRNQRIATAIDMRRMLSEAGQRSNHPRSDSLPTERVVPTGEAPTRLDTDRMREEATELTRIRETEERARREADEQRQREAVEAAQRVAAAQRAEAERRAREEQERHRAEANKTMASFPPVVPPPPSGPTSGPGYTPPGSPGVTGGGATAGSSSKVKWVIFGVGALVVGWLLVVGTVALVSILRPGNRNSSSFPIFAGTPTPVPTPTPLIDMVYVPGGNFMMGSGSDDTEGYTDEKPPHRVSLSSFYLGKYEVTQAEWNEVMDTTLQQLRDKKDSTAVLRAVGNTYPIYYVSWDDAQEFVKRLNSRHDRFIYRLPTEAEWEYAARAGSTTPFAGIADEMGWYKTNSGEEMHSVGGKKKNSWGFFDMHGNLWEWCQDYYSAAYYANSTENNPTGSSTGTERVVRGGCYYAEPRSARSAYRGKVAQSDRGNLIGFRVAASAR